MAYIAPNTTIHLLSGVPLDPSYTDTLYFGSRAAQTAHFLNFPNQTFTYNSYQRAYKGSIDLNVLADTIYNCNYLMFQNTSFGSKWFYAFITSIEYINNGCSRVYYELDVLQTWFFDYDLEPCFVERETPATDVIGDNVLPEPVDLGDMVVNSIETTGWFDDYLVVLALAQNQPSDPGE